MPKRNRDFTIFYSDRFTSLHFCCLRSILHLKQVISPDEFSTGQSNAGALVKWCPLTVPSVLLNLFHINKIPRHHLSSSAMLFGRLPGSASTFMPCIQSWPLLKFREQLRHNFRCNSFHSRTYPIKTFVVVPVMVFQDQFTTFHDVSIGSEFGGQLERDWSFNDKWPIEKRGNHSWPCVLCLAASW